MSKPDNPPAFPRRGNELTMIVATQDGMTLRDYFAAKAMQAIVPHDMWARALVGASSNPMSQLISGSVSSAYAIADAMLEARDIK